MTEGMGPRIREDTGRGNGGVGMGPRIREDTGRGMGMEWVPASARTRGGGAGVDVLCMGGRLAGRGILGNGMLSVRGAKGDEIPRLRSE